MGMCLSECTHCMGGDSGHQHAGDVVVNIDVLECGTAIVLMAIKVPEYGAIA